MNGFDDLPPEHLRNVVGFLSEQQLKYRRMFLDGRRPAVQEVAKEAPELCMIDLATVDGTTMLAGYLERQAKFDTAPFDPLGRDFRLYPGGVTIWSGFPGTGKTTLLRQLVCHLLHRGHGVFVASLEESPDDTLVRLAMTAAGTSEPTAHQAQWFVDAYADQLRLWGLVGFAPALAVLGAMRYAIKHEGAKHCVIDSLTCLDIGGSDWDGQRGLANQLCAVARSSGTHVHLVAHPRKPVKHDTLPDIAEIAGSSDLGRLADNVIFVRRNLDVEPPAFDQPTPMEIVIRKQRHGTGTCRLISGWFHRQDRQFDLQHVRYGPIRYLPDDAYG